MGSADKRIMKTKIEFIKSAAMLLLAVILLVGAVFAWFGQKELSEIGSITLSIESPNSGLYLGDDVAIKESIVLPCATRLDRTDVISADDFSKALYMLTYPVHSPSPVSAEVKVELDDSVTGFHYYIDSDHKNETVGSYAESIYEKEVDYDTKATFTFTESDLKTGSEGSSEEYVRKVAVVFWADYPLDGNGELVVNSFTQSLTFKGITVRFSETDPDAETDTETGEETGEETNS